MPTNPKDKAKTTTTPEVKESEARLRQRSTMMELTDDAVKVTIVGGNAGVMTFTHADLPQSVQVKLPSAGLARQLSNAASGKRGAEAEEAMTKLYEAFKKGEWTCRQPAQPKISLSTVQENFKKLSPEEQAVAKQLFEKFGIKLG